MRWLMEVGGKVGWLDGWLTVFGDESCAGTHPSCFSCGGTAELHAV